MNEALFQFIWQYSLYNPVGLATTDGEAVTVIHPGKINRHSGPDFEEARIRIGSTTFVGNVELHIHTSDWEKHGHQHDEAYQNIILHVVCHHAGNSNPRFPTLALGRHIPAHVLHQYTNLIQTTQPIPCARQLHTIKPITLESWLNRLLAERWEQKLDEWKELLESTAGDWRNLLYWRMAANFGFKVNATPFLLMARSLPVNVLARHKGSLLQIEALLFGQAGMLHDKFTDEYPRQLQQEYFYLQQKYALTPISAHLWRFMRMRPPNFPTVRIAQFAALVHQSLHLFAQIAEAAAIAEIHPFLELQASNYWDNHYRFDEAQEEPAVKRLGASSIQNIIINTIAPIQFLYANYHGNMARQEAALQLLSSVKPEENNIIKLWKATGMKMENAAQTQALLQLFNNYCSNKKCLECAIGLGIIKSQPVK